MLAIVGAGSIGLALASQLARGGTPALLVTREAAAAARISAEGVVAEDPASEERSVLAVEAIAGIEGAGAAIGDGPVLLCTRSYDAEAAGLALAAHAPRAAIACLSNGLQAEDAVARHATCVIGGLWRQACTRVDDRHVRFQGTARIVVGPWAGAGAAGAARALAAQLRRAGLSVGLSEHVLEDKWLKLCVNLMSAPNALIRREDHTTAAFVDVKAQLLEEAAAALASEGIPARSCDGLDRSLEEEIAHVRGSLARGASARPLPLYNSVWSALRRRLPLESLEYHRRIVALAERHGQPARANRAVLAAVLSAQETGAGPESISAASLLA